MLDGSQFPSTDEGIHVHVIYTTNTDVTDDTISVYFFQAPMMDQDSQQTHDKKNCPSYQH